MLGAHLENISPKLLEAYKDQVIRLVLTRLICSRNLYLIPPESLPPGTEIYFSFHTARHNVPIE